MALNQEVLAAFPFDEIIGFPLCGIGLEDGDKPCIGCSGKCHTDILASACRANDTKLTECTRCKSDKQGCRQIPDPLLGIFQAHWVGVEDVRQYILKHMGANLSRRPQWRTQYAISRGLEYVEASGLALAALIEKLNLGRADDQTVLRLNAAHAATIVEQNAALADLLVAALANQANGTGFGVSGAKIEDFAARSKGALAIFSTDQGTWQDVKRSLDRLAV
ncbi:hypothetical protein QBC34DRAFT_102702 [Podospora aff. communis PSN243]|uniref:Uncharacterized protein n=1 Tax=Podospora aff. communis PSN243 TaxID=3040156 RepID=A0AAV9GKS1_9PEZI|nr:hypothetical protein QBC34DRAFT_102702 [Podospora aff. communis PSN243]